MLEYVGYPLSILICATVLLFWCKCRRPPTLQTKHDQTLKPSKYRIVGLDP